MAARERARALQAVDVGWNIDTPIRDGQVTIRNVGTTTAYSVTAVVRVDDTRFDVTPGDVASDEVFTVDAAEIYEQKIQSNRASVASMAASTSSGLLPRGCPSRPA